MNARLLLTSSNLASPALGLAVAQLAAGAQRAAVITTAEVKLKERNRNAIIARDTLLQAGVGEVVFFDVDHRPAAELAEFGLIYIGGGNPYYLARRLRESGADGVLETWITDGRPLIASSAGAVVLGPSLEAVAVFDPSVPDLGWTSRAGLGLIDFAVLPHANRFKARLASYEERLAQASQRCGCKIEELPDGAGLLVTGNELTRLEVSVVGS